MENPLLNLSTNNPFNAIAFDKINKEHFVPALKEAIKEGNEQINKIISNTEEPNFKNVIIALEDSSEKMNYIANIYFNLMGADSDNDFKNLAQEISPMLSKYENEILMNDKIFQKVKAVYDKKDTLNLDDEDLRLVNEKYKEFTRNGALLDEKKKSQLMKINIELSKLSPTFGQNALNSQNDYELIVTDEQRLSGIPDSAKEAAKNLANKKNKKGWIFNLQYPSLIPVVTYADDRELRKEITLAAGKVATSGEYDNKPIIQKIINLKSERAKLLGYKTHSHYILEERMAKKPENVMEFLEKLYNASMPVAKKEKEELEKFAKELDNIDELQSYDWMYYSEKLKMKKFNFDSEQLRPYFKMENVINGIFKVANKLYGINFVERNDIPKYHEEVKTYEVTDKNNKFVGLFYTDLFPRETKRSGAWMTNYITQGRFNGEIVRPHVSIVASLTRPTKTKPSLLSLNEVTTIFHEFGHALHGLLSKCKYPSLASPNVYWDFVELPSQIMENWVTEKDALDLFANHYESGEKIPTDLINRIKEAKKFNAGYASLRQLNYGYLDMGWHFANHSKDVDVKECETKSTAKLELFEKDPEVIKSCSFGHIFAGGYSSGYYSYKWAEVLEADAFEYFKENGIFNKKIANKFKENVLEKGNSIDPMKTYVNFRGQEPNPDALLKRDGLI